MKCCCSTNLLNPGSNVSSNASSTQSQRDKWHVLLSRRFLISHYVPKASKWMKMVPKNLIRIFTYAQFDSLKALEKKFLKYNHRFFWAVQTHTSQTSPIWQSG